MTFKHIKFEDSPTMRALEKVAKEKGLVKPELFQKKASINPKIDYTPTDSLMENILKLCSGLRKQGLEKNAMELETNFINYKQAQTLYETSKEKGEDLVHAAHPEGSHKMENVDSSEAIFEDILDNQIKSLEVVNKKPNGKLVNADSIIREVKKALAQDTGPTDMLNNQISELMNSVRHRGQQVVRDTENELTVSWANIANNLYSKSQDPTIDNLHKMQSIIKRQKWRLKPGTVFGLSEDKWSRISPLLNDMSNLIDKAVELRTKINEIAGKKLLEEGDKPVKPVITDMEKKIRGVAAQFSALSSQISSDDPKDAEALNETKVWLKQKSAELLQLADKFRNETDKDAVMGVYQTTLNKYLLALQKSQQEWS